MEDLNSTELYAAKTIINKGLESAAQSLSFFMKEEISFNELSFSVNKVNKKTDFTSKFGENIHLLITNVIGELKGVCCLIFSEEEANQLQQTALPKEITENPELMAEMSDAILLEVDNIISASVITKFSNILSHKIHGGIPELKKLSFEEMSDFLSNNYSQSLFIISFKTQFKSAKLNFRPEFLWLFDYTFLDSIKSFSLIEENISKLEVNNFA
jgi:chemotaxis protein CheY-P-specific phosphatase CheC